MNHQDQVIAHLKEYGSITPIEALSLFGCFRLASVINRLRKQYRIETELVQNEGKGSYAKYRLLDFALQN